MHINSSKNMFYTFGIVFIALDMKTANIPFGGEHCSGIIIILAFIYLGVPFVFFLIHELFGNLSVRVTANIV